MASLGRANVYEDSTFTHASKPIPILSVPRWRSRIFLSTSLSIFMKEIFHFLTILSVTNGPKNELVLYKPRFPHYVSCCHIIYSLFLSFFFSIFLTFFFSLFLFLSLFCRSLSTCVSYFWLYLTIFKFFPLSLYYNITFITFISVSSLSLSLSLSLLTRWQLHYAWWSPGHQRNAVTWWGHWALLHGHCQVTFGVWDEVMSRCQPEARRGQIAMVYLWMGWARLTWVGAGEVGSCVCRPGWLWVTGLAYVCVGCDSYRMRLLLRFAHNMMKHTLLD